MYDIARHLRRLLFFVALVLSTTRAHAWIETSVQSDDVTLEIAADGTAVVHHEVLMRIRGGPMQELVIAGVDSDAEPLPDATVSRARHGARGNPIPLMVSREGDSLRLAIDHPKGIRRGRFLFSFRYRTDLSSRGLVRVDGSELDVRWVGPRFDDGIDSARVLFRLPAAANPPRLPEERDAVSLALTDELGGVFLSNLRRSGTHDELEVIRPHVAKGEPVMWRIRADTKALRAAESEAPDPGPLPAAEPAKPKERAFAIGGLVLLALLYSLLVGLAHQLFAKHARRRQARVRALVPLPVTLRSALAGACLGGAAGLAALTPYATAAGGSLAAALLLAWLRSPAYEPKMRGPGEWKEVTQAPPSTSGGWLDADRLPGFLLLLSLLAGVAGAFWWVGRTSLYDGLLVLFGAAALLPVFFTGRLRELPPTADAQQHRFLARLARRFSKSKAVRCTLVGRFPTGVAEPDELRLNLELQRPLAGLRAIEVGFEHWQGPSGFLRMPCVLVRVDDGSQAYDALPRTVVWSRGRGADERVAVLRPKLGSVRMSRTLLERLIVMLWDPREPVRRTQRPAPRTASKLRGIGSLTSKPATPASPLHVT